MKKSFLTKAALVLFTLTATTLVHAQDYSSDDYELTEGKIEATAIIQVDNMQEEINTIIKKISDIQYEVGVSTDNSNGLIKALGEKIEMTSELKAELGLVSQAMKNQNGDELFASFNKADKILEQAKKNLAEAKVLLKTNH